MRILYFGPLEYGSTCLMRLRAFEQLGHEVASVASMPPVMPRGLPMFAFRVAWRLRHPLDLTRGNQQLLALARSTQFDVFWIDKGLTLRADTLRELRRLQPALRVAGYSPDDMGSAHNHSRYFLDGLPSYDAYFTTKSYGVAELHALGVPHVFFNGNAYDPATHHPVTLSAEERAAYGCDVGFVGAFEHDRAQQILHLARHGIRVRITGDDPWLQFHTAHPELSPPHPHALGADYAKTLCGAAINLCFLRKMNRDLQTQRSIEIPACGAFMLAERTDEHRALFEEGREAEYFSSPDELLEKVRYYLAHPEARARIAAAGLQRCRASGYSYAERLKTALQQLAAL